MAIIVERSITADPLNIPTLLSIEACGVALKTAFTVINIYSVYQKPQLAIQTSDLLQLLSSSDAVILGGDFNSNHQAFNCITPNPNGSRLHSFLLAHPSFQLQSPPQPTHYHAPTQTWDILDYFVVKGLPQVALPEVVYALRSDHLPLLWDVPFTSQKMLRLAPTESDYDSRRFQQLLQSKILTAAPLLDNADQIDAAVEELTVTIQNSVL